MRDRRSILLVEDREADVELTRTAMKDGGIDAAVTVLRDGAAALDYLFCRRAYAARSLTEAPDLILLDLKLPKVSGLDVLGEVKSDARTRAIPIVVLTASDRPDDIAAAYRLGVNSYVTKPLSFSQFRAAVGSLGLYWFDINVAPPREAFGVLPQS
jgi:CheY-like chemotaxis protein